MIIDGVDYTGVSIEVYCTIQMVKGSQELVTDLYLSKSIANVILESELNDKDIQQVFDLTSTRNEHIIEIMGMVETMRKKLT